MDKFLEATHRSELPLISVIIPTYNRPAYLKDAIASVVSQTYPNLEIIVSDDGSSESPEPITKAFQDPRLRLRRNPKNLGIGLNATHAFAEATGKYVVMLNPKLEDIAVVGIGYTARQIRERFLSTLESCYYLQPLEGATLLRVYPGPWQVWGETEDDDYELLGEFTKKPSGEEMANLFADEEEQDGDSTSPNRPKKGSLFAELGQFIRALTQ